MKIIVLKIGGKELNKPAELRRFVACVKKIRSCGFHCVVAHGGGNEVDVWLKKLNIKPRFINGLRATDKKTLEVVEAVLCGKVNKALVSAFIASKVSAAGFSGKDAGTAVAKKVSNTVLGRVGNVERVNTGMLAALLKARIVPVVATVAMDAKGGSLNVNADSFASKLAQALHAQRLVLVSDVPGVYDEKQNVISTLKAREAKKLMKSPAIKSGMIPKLLACAGAVENGVELAYVLDSKTLHLKLNDVLAGKPCGTMIQGNG